ncbi:MAG: DedA family protein [Alphaproteobacteria bacterium]|nr:DedA family protein [Alphaproteobacteria bacterium]
MPDAAGPLGLFLSAFLSATLLPGSSEAALIALLALGKSDPAILVAVATAGNVLGSIVNWAMGRYFAHFSDRRWFPVKPAAFERAVAWTGRFGSWSLLFAWLPVIGDPLTVVAGALRVGFWRFVLLVTLGKAGRYVFIALAYAGWQAA